MEDPVTLVVSIGMHVTSDSQFTSTVPDSFSFFDVVNLDTTPGSATAPTGWIVSFEKSSHPTYDFGVVVSDDVNLWNVKYEYQGPPAVVSGPQELGIFTFKVTSFVPDTTPLFGAATYENVIGGVPYAAVNTISTSFAVPVPAAAGVGFSMLAGFGGLFGLRKKLRQRSRIA